MPFHSHSLGKKQRVALARAMMIKKLSDMMNLHQPLDPELRLEVETYPSK